MKIDIRVLPLDPPVTEGDWQAKPYKWTVIGPFAEVKNFTTKSDAMLYASCRRKAPSFVRPGKNWLDAFHRRQAKRK